MALDLETIKTTLEEEYSAGVEAQIVRPSSGEPHVELTGSSYNMNIFHHGQVLVLAGEMYGEKIMETCAADEDVLIGRISSHF